LEIRHRSVRPISAKHAQASRFLQQSRLLHHSHVITIRGDSYRLRAKRKAGLIKPDSIHHDEQVVRG
ncbi:ATP-binding protein, partial [Burkholderia cenocepacia]